MDKINENTTGYLTLTFKDKASALVVPATVTIRIDCPENDAVILDDTVVTPGSSVEITLESDYNSLQADAPVETRIVTVTATYTGGGVITEEYQYMIRDLKFVE